MKLLITLFICLTAHADDKQPAKDQINCDGPYTMYTHPDKHCREKLAQEYKAMIQQMLDKARSKQNVPNQ